MSCFPTALHRSAPHRNAPLRQRVRPLLVCSLPRSSPSYPPTLDPFCTAHCYCCHYCCLLSVVLFHASKLHDTSHQPTVPTRFIRPSIVYSQFLPYRCRHVGSFICHHPPLLIISQVSSSPPSSLPPILPLYSNAPLQPQPSISFLKRPMVRVSGKNVHCTSSG